MIKRCIVSAFTRLRKTAVLFDSQFKDGYAKSLIVLTACFAPAVANAQLEFNNWYGTSGASATPLNECKSVYKITYSTQKDGKIAFSKDGVNLNSANTVFASNVSDLDWYPGDDGKNYGVWYKGEAGTDITLYYISGSLKDTLSAEKPTYTTVGLSGIGYQYMSLKSTPLFTASFCGTDGASSAPEGATFQWQSYDKTNKSWVNINDEIASTYEPAAGTLPDSSIVRVEMTVGGNSMYSSSLMAFYDEPSVDIKLEGTTPFETVQRPKYEHEVDYGKSFTLTAEALGASKLVGGYTLYTRSDNDESWAEFATVEDANEPLVIKPSQNLEYKIAAKCEDMRPGHEGDIITGSETFFVRVRFSWDEGAKVDTLFFDNFGVFPDINKYTTFDGQEYTDELTTVGDATYKIDRYWAPDYFESVKNHKYAHENPNVGPFDSEDCAADNYKHFVCWENGACDGYRIEDGYYAIVPNPDYSNCGMPKKDYWNGYDHTTEAEGVQGGMLFVNCKEGSDKTVLFERTIQTKNECTNTRLLFSAYVNNATAIATNAPVNVRLIVRDAEGDVVYETPSGNIYPRSVKGGLWANLSFMFTASKGGRYTIQLVNNQEGGAENAGNDLLFDDILIVAAYPTVDVYRNRQKTDVAPVDTCQEVEVPLYVLNKDDIKKYITTPRYLYQYSKDTVNWINIGAIGDVDSFVVSLNKKNPTYWDTTYFRGIVASNDDIITKILANDAPELSCDSVFAVSAPFRVVYDYSGPIDTVYNASLCAGETFSVKLPTYGRPKYRFVDSYTGDVLNNMDSTFSYVVKAENPVDTLFYYIVEQRLGCTDTMKVRVHRKLFVDFKTPDPFVTCLYDTPAQLTELFPSTGASFVWSTGEYTSTPNDGLLVIPSTVARKGTFTVVGSAEDYCVTTKTFEYDIHDSVKVSLLADRADSLFCLSDPTAKFNLTAVTVQGLPVTYYWMKDDVQVAMTEAPDNTFSFGDIIEGKHVFGVRVVDEVCNKTGETSEFKAELPVETREPITIALAADPTVCENLTANAFVQCAHLLKSDTTNINWTVTSGNAAFQTAVTTADGEMKGANVVIPNAPETLTPTTEQILLRASVYDRVCTTNAPVATAAIDLYKVLNLTVSTNRNDNMFCFNETNTSITFTAVTNRGDVKQYEWLADRVPMAVTDGSVPSYSFPIDSEGLHTYVVKASDGVCSISGTSDSVYSFPIEVRKPVTITIDGDLNVCENSTANAFVKFEHLLKPNATDVVWTVETGNGSFQVGTTVTNDLQQSSNTMTPASTTNTTEIVTVKATVNDDVCLTPVSGTFNVNMYKLLDISIATERTDNLFCMSSENQGIKFDVTTNRGYVDAYFWYADDVLIATTNHEVSSYTYPVVTEGTHVYTVKVSDGVCNVPNGTEAVASSTIQTRMPITMQLVADTLFCENQLLPVTATFEHLLNDPTIPQTVVWGVSNNATLSSMTTAVTDNMSSVVATPAPLTNDLEDVTISAMVSDVVCPQNSPVAATMSSHMHKNINIALAADGINGAKCLTTPEDANIGLTVTVNRGNPEYFLWSDEVITTDVQRPYTLVLGDNIIAVNAYDSVCVKNGVAAVANVGVVTRVPLNVTLTQTRGVSPTCVGEVIDFTATADNNFPGDNIVYSWSPALTTDATLSFIPPVGQNPVVVTMIADNAICPAQTASGLVVVQDSVYIALRAPLTLCQNQDKTEPVDLVVDVISGNPQGFVWSTGVTTVDPVLTDYPTETTVYSVHAIDAICANSTEVYSAPVSVSNLFTLEVAAVSHEVQMGTNVQLVSNVLEFPSSIPVAWNMIYGANEANVGVAPVGPFEYKLDINGDYQFYAVADGGHCGTIVSNVLNIDVADYYQIPTAFTPYNANPKNNIFMKGYSVEIFNRYQQMVFEGEDGWDGQYNGKMADPGTYFYRLRKKDGRVLKGTIELVKF